MVVVYKIDRLSRALVDFNKLIEPPSVHGRLHVARANWGRISSPRTWRPRPTCFGPVANSMPNRDLTSLNNQSYPITEQRAQSHRWAMVALGKTYEPFW